MRLSNCHLWHFPLIQLKRLWGEIVHFCNMLLVTKTLIQTCSRRLRQSVWHSRPRFSPASGSRCESKGDGSERAIRADAAYHHRLGRALTRHLLSAWGLCPLHLLHRSPRPAERWKCKRQQLIMQAEHRYRELEKCGLSLNVEIALVSSSDRVSFIFITVAIQVDRGFELQHIASPFSFPWLSE